MSIGKITEERQRTIAPPPIEIEVRVSSAWLRLIKFCQTELPHGTLCVKIANGQPTVLDEEHTKRTIRFDREESLPVDYGDIKFS